MDYKKLYIGGELRDASDNNRYNIICPGDEAKVAEIAWANSQDVSLAIEAAQQGFQIWSATPVAERCDYMLRLRQAIVDREDELRGLISMEMGKTYADTEEDFVSITNSLQYYAETIQEITDIDIPDRVGDHTHRLVHQPVGVVVAFIAYNFPMLNLGFKLGPALASGCSIIIKPSEYSPLSAYWIGELCHEIGLPAGVVNILCGDVQEVAVLLSSSKVPRLVTMIGSTQTAQRLIAQSCRSSIKRYSMECGGNAPFIVMPDADLDKAVAIGSALKTVNAGQICVAPNRYYIHRDIIDEFVARVKKEFLSKNMGYKAAEPNMGPLANKASVIRCQELTAMALDQGATLISGGEMPDMPGYYFEPTILQFEEINPKVFDEEVFGPIVFVTAFDTKEEVIELANDTDAGLASYVFSADSDTLEYFAQRLEFGEVQLNGVKYDIYLPHGGIKNSGIGVDCSEYALDDYLIKKRVTLAIG